jgi:hypothetical protein
MRWNLTSALQIAVLVVAGLVATACYTVPHGSSSYGTPGYSGYWEAPTWSVGVFSGAPEVPVYSSSTWYYGVHPHPDGYHKGRFCHRSGAHNHDYDPFRRHRYEFHDGYYFWLGDPWTFGEQRGAYAYSGHHPHPHYFGSYCYMDGRHHHNYSPHRRNIYDFRSGVFHFTGTFGNDYHKHRKHYDAHGRRHESHKRGYEDHRQWKHYRERQHSNDHGAHDRRDAKRRERDARQRHEEAERKDRDPWWRKHAERRDEDNRQQQKVEQRERAKLAMKAQRSWAITPDLRVMSAGLGSGLSQ